MKKKKADRRQSVQSVEVGMLVLKCLAAVGGSATLAALSKDTKLAPAKAHRYLVALARAGFVRQEADTGRYSLGPESLVVGLSALAQLDVVAIAARSLALFSEAANECCFLAVWGTHGPTIVRWQESARPVTVNVRVGSVMPLLSSATGHVFVAWSKQGSLAPELLSDLGRGTNQATGSSVRSENDIEQLRRKVRNQGFATVDGLMLTGISAMSVPVFDAQSNLVAAITTLGPRGHLDLNPKGPVARSLLDVARDTSRQLGWTHSGS